MTYDIYRYIFLGAALLAGLMLIVTVLLFFLLKIPNVIGDLTGSSARKAIENIRNQNELSGEKTYKSSLVNKQRGKLTDKIGPSGKIHKNPSGSLGAAMATSKISQADSPHVKAEETSLLDQNLTTLLDSADSTVPIGNETTLLNADVAVGQSDSGETTVLGDMGVLTNNAVVKDSVFAIEYDITYIHTDEVI